MKNSAHLPACCHADGRLYNLRRFWLLTLFTVLMAALSACSVADISPARAPTPQAVAEAASQPAISISPSGGYAGAYIQVTGHGWPAREVVTVVLADDWGNSGILVATNVDQDGEFVTGFTYPIGERWLTAGTRRVTAQTPGGRDMAQAAFTLSPPEGVAALTPIPTDTPTPAATATPTPTPHATDTPAAPATNPAMPTPHVTDTPPANPPTATPTSTPLQAAPTPTPPGSEPVVQANMVPVDGSDDNEQFRVSAIATDAQGSLDQVWAILELPSIDLDRRVQLKHHKNKTQVKWNKNRLEIQGPDPEAILAQLRQFHGVLVPDGQLVVFKQRENNDQKLEFRDGMVLINSSAVVLKVVAIDTTGTTYTATAVPATVDEAGNADKENQGRGNDDDDGDERGKKNDDDDDDDERGKKNDDDDNGRGKKNDDG